MDASELGWLKMPTLMHYAWASQWYDYYTNMLAQVDSYNVVVPIARDVVRLLPSPQLLCSDHISLSLSHTHTHHCGRACSSSR
jgi:hypothetical protein